MVHHILISCGSEFQKLSSRQKKIVPILKKQNNPTNNYLENLLPIPQFPTVFILFSGFDTPLSKKPGCLHFPQTENLVKKSILSYLEGQTLYLVLKEKEILAKITIFNLIILLFFSLEPRSMAEPGKDHQRFTIFALYKCGDLTSQNMNY